MSGGEPAAEASPGSFEFLIRGPTRQARLRLEGSFFVVGRAEPLPIFRDDPSISREHVAVVATPEGLRVRDLGGRNGTLLNGRALARYAEVPLALGDELVCGRTSLRLVREGEARAAESVTVDREGRTGAYAAADVMASLEDTQGFEGEEDDQAALLDTDLAELPEEEPDLGAAEPQASAAEPAAEAALDPEPESAPEPASAPEPEADSSADPVPDREPEAELER